MEVFLTGFLEGTLAHEVGMEEMDAELLHLGDYLGATGLLMGFESGDIASGLLDVGL